MMKDCCTLDTLWVRAQVGLAFALLLLFFALIFVLVFFWKEMSAQQVGFLGGLTTVIPTLLALTMNAFFPKHNVSEALTNSNPPGVQNVPTTTINAQTVYHTSGPGTVSGSPATPSV